MKSKTKNNPQTISGIEQNTNNLISNIAKNQDKVWYLSRYKKDEYTTQKVPSWKDFYHLVSQDSQPPKFIVLYLSYINDSPTKYEIAQEILLHCKEKAEALGLETANLVSDHAIYSKALEISL